MLNIHQNKQKLQCTNVIQKAIPLHMETSFQVLPASERLLLFTTEGLTAKTSEKTRASGNVTECSSFLLLLKAQSPLTVLVSVFKGEWKALLYSKVLCLWTFKWPWYALLGTERAKLISHCVDAQEHKTVELLGKRRKKLPWHPEHPSLSPATPKLFCKVRDAVPRL